MTRLQQQTLKALRSRHAGFDGFSNGEKVLQAMAYLCDVIKVDEDFGPNHGEYVDDFLKEAGGLGPGYPWCAAAINWCCEMLGVPNPDKSDAAVIGWKNWAATTGRRKTTPKRGMLCYWLNRDNTGHIGIVSSFLANKDHVLSIEGNTNAAGSREGEAIARKERHKTKWHGYISLD